MLQAATRRHRARRVDTAIPFLYVRNLSIHIDQKRGPVGQERLFAQHAVLPHHYSFVIGQHRKRRVQLLRPMI